MQPTEWLSVISNVTDENGYYNTVEPLWAAINQRHCDSLDDVGLEKFHEAALGLCSTAEDLERVLVRDKTTLQAQTELMLAGAFSQAANDDRVKAIYIEYSYDGGPWGQLTAFLCLKHSRSEDSDWPAYFEQSIDGPNISALFAYDPNFAFEPNLEFVARAYVDAVLLATIIRGVQAFPNSRLPLAFARHDGYPVHFETR